MDQKPKIPTLKDSQKPQVRIKGLAARLSLVERIKQFKKKDLAFILAGMGVLFMAPLAEHFMMSPENASDGTFKPGWDFMNKGGRFGDGSSPFEPGVNGMAPGSFAGSGGDVITPLNVRDPSALVMGPGASQQPAATAAAAAPAAKENTDWKDAIANAASKGASAATKAASLPVPKPNLTNAGLRGLSAGSGGGGGATWSAPPINSRPPTAAQSNSLGYVSKLPDYKGVGTRGPTGGSASSLAALKKAAENAGSALNRQGSAANNAEQAAGMNMPSGSGGGIGEGGMGKDDKGGSGNSGKDSKSLGESLAFLAAKANQEKAIDLYWKLKEKEAMLWPDLKQKMLEEAVMTPFKALTSGIAEAVKGFGAEAPNGSYWDCTGAGGDHQIVKGDTQKCSADVKSGWCCNPSGPSNATCVNILTAAAQPSYSCVKKKGDASEATPKAETTPAGQEIAKARADTYGPNDTGKGKMLPELCKIDNATAGTAMAEIKAGAKALTEARDAMSTNSNSGECGAQAIVSGGGSIPGYNRTAKEKLNAAFDAMSSCLSFAKAATGDVAKTLDGEDKVDNALAAAFTAANVNPMVPKTVAQQDDAAQKVFATFDVQLLKPAAANADQIKTEFPKIGPFLTEAKAALDQSKKYLDAVADRVGTPNGTALNVNQTVQEGENAKLVGDALKAAQADQESFKQILTTQQQRYDVLLKEYQRLRESYNSGCEIVGVKSGDKPVVPANAKVTNASGYAGQVVDGIPRVKPLQGLPSMPAPASLKAFVSDTQTVKALPITETTVTTPPANLDLVRKVANANKQDGSYAQLKSNMVDNLKSVGGTVTQADGELNTARSKMTAQAATARPE